MKTYLSALLLILGLLVLAQPARAAGTPTDTLTITATLSPSTLAALGTATITPTSTATPSSTCTPDPAGGRLLGTATVTPTPTVTGGACAELLNTSFLCLSSTSDASAHCPGDSFNMAVTFCNSNQYYLAPVRFFVWLQEASLTSTAVTADLGTPGQWLLFGDNGAQMPPLAGGAWGTAPLGGGYTDTFTSAYQCITSNLTLQLPVGLKPSTAYRLRVQYAEIYAGQSAAAYYDLGFVSASSSACGTATPSSTPTQSLPGAGTSIPTPSATITATPSATAGQGTPVATIVALQYGTDAAITGWYCSSPSAGFCPGQSLQMGVTFCSTNAAYLPPLRAFVWLQDTSLSLTGTAALGTPGQWLVWGSQGQAGVPAVTGAWGVDPFNAGYAVTLPGPLQCAQLAITMRLPADALPGHVYRLRVQWAENAVTSGSGWFWDIPVPLSIATAGACNGTYTAGPSATITATPTPSPAASAVQGTPTPTIAPVQSGIVLRLVLMPSLVRGTTQVTVFALCSGPVPSASLRCYSGSYALVKQQAEGPLAKGWSRFTLPAGWFSGLANGRYHLSLGAPAQASPAKATLFLLK